MHATRQTNTQTDTLLSALSKGVAYSDNVSDGLHAEPYNYLKNKQNKMKENEHNLLK